MMNESIKEQLIKAQEQSLIDGLIINQDKICFNIHISKENIVRSLCMHLKQKYKLDTHYSKNFHRIYVYVSYF